MKRIAPAITAIIMAFAMTGPAVQTGTAPAFGIAACAEGVTSGDYEYTVQEDGTAAIKKYLGTETEITIPAEIDGKAVTVICDNAFNTDVDIVAVTIPKSVTNVGRFAFSECSELIKLNVDEENEAYAAVNGVLYTKDMTKMVICPLGQTIVVLPESITEIESYAFYGCSKLSSVTIPDSVTYIGQSAFWGCESLTKLQLPDSVTVIDEYAFYMCSHLVSVNVPSNVKKLSRYAFAFCYDLEVITLPEGLEFIDESAMEGCSKLEKIPLPSTVTTIESSAFEDCTALLNINIPEKVTAIGSYAFDGCTELINVTLPTRLVDIGSYAFRNTKWLGNRQKEDPLVIVDNIVIDGKLCTGKVEIPKGVTAVAGKAFENNHEITEVVIPDTVFSIGEQAFADCYKLKDITIPESVTEIKGLAFNDTLWMEDRIKEDPMVIVNGILIEGRQCKGFITIPENVKYINEYSFWNAPDVTGVDIPDNVVGIGDLAFFNVGGLNELNISPKVSSIGISAFVSTGWMDKQRSTASDHLVVLNNMLIDATDVKGDVVVPDGVTKLVGYVFNNEKELTSVKLPDTLTWIGCFAFRNCKTLKRVEIPESVTFIYNNAFDGCEHDLVLVGKIGSIAERYAQAHQMAFEALPTDMTECIVTLPTGTYEYEGKPVTPKPTISFNNSILTDGEDYTVEYINNDGVGSAEIKITGKGKFTGEYTIKFEIAEHKKPDDPDDPDGPDDPDDPGKKDILGDINRDGTINVSDISKAAAYVKGRISLDETEQVLADVNCDGSVNVSDISRIAAHVKGIRELTT